MLDKIRKFIKACELLQVPDELILNKLIMSKNANFAIPTITGIVGYLLGNTAVSMIPNNNGVSYTNQLKNNMGNSLIQSLASTGALMGGTVGYLNGEKIFSDMSPSTAKILGAGVGGLIGSLSGNTMGSLMYNSMG